MGKRDPLPEGGPGRAMFLKPGTYDEIRERLEGVKDYVFDPAIFEVTERGGTGETIVRLKKSGGVSVPPGGGGGRYVPRIGGEGGTSLYFSPGTVSYVRIGEEDRVDEKELPGLTVTPVYPRIDGVALNAEEP